MRTASSVDGKFLLSVENNKLRSVEYVEADYLLIASGNSRQVGLDNLFLFILMPMFKIHEIFLFHCPCHRVIASHLNLVIQL